MDGEELRTARLVLRGPEPGDASAILAVHRDPLAYAHNPSDALHSLAEAERLCARWRAHWARHGFGYWVVRAHDDPAVLGFCGLKAMELHGRPVRNLFYRFAPGQWGRGYATEAATAVVTWAGPGEWPIIARVRPDNHASHRVASRAGLRRAPELDTGGFDGPDQLYVHNWSDQSGDWSRPDPT